jgi:hypothetical protein
MRAVQPHQAIEGKHDRFIWKQVGNPMIAT